MVTIAIDHVGLTVTDLEASVTFYRDVAGMVVLRRSNRPVGGAWFDTLTDNVGAVIEVAFMGLGELKLQLVHYLEAGGPPARVAHAAAGSPHLCLVVDDVDAKHEAVRGIPQLHATALVDLMNTQARSFYVRDPDGVHVEFLQYVDTPAQPAAAQP